MAAGRYDIVVEEAVTYQKSITWRDINGLAVPLHGYTAKLQIRAGIGDRHPVLVSLTSDPPEGITINPNMGLITFTLTPEQSSLVRHRSQYSLVLTTPTGDKIRLIQGKVSVSPEVTF